MEKVIGIILGLIFGGFVLVKVVIAPDMSWLTEWVKGPKITRVYQGDCMLMYDRDTGKTVNKECIAKEPSKTCSEESLFDVQGCIITTDNVLESIKICSLRGYAMQMGDVNYITIGRCVVDK